MGTVVAGDKTGGGGCVDVGHVLHRGGLGGDILRVGVLGQVPEDWEGAGWLSPPGDTAADGADAMKERGRDLDIPSPGRGNGRGGTAIDRNLRRQSPDHYCKIYCDKDNYGPMSGSGAAPRGAVFEAVVGAGENKSGGDTGGGTGVGDEKGLMGAGGRGDGGRERILRQWIL